MTHTDAPALPDVEISEDFAHELCASLAGIESLTPQTMTTARGEMLAADLGLRDAIRDARGTAALSGQLTLDLLAILEMGVHLAVHKGDREAWSFEHMTLLFRIRAEAEV